MARFTYRDWVGRQARCLREIRNKARSFSFPQGEIVEVMGYDAYLKFTIRSNSEVLWKVTSRDIELVDDPLITLESRVIAYVRNATCLTDDHWVGVPEVARAVGSNSASVSSLMKRLCERGNGSRFINYEEPKFQRQEGKGVRGGYGYRISPSQERAVSAIDILLSDQDLV